MASLIRGNKALEIIHKFYNKDYVIWVEGQDDMIFWQYVFNSIVKINVKVKPANGKPALKQYIDKVMYEDANIIIACDLDYDDLIDKKYVNDKIIYTFGYSIENSMYCPKIISKNVCKLSKTQNDYTKEIEDWYKDVESDVMNLLIYDVANCKYSKSIKVLGDCPKEFLKTDLSVKLCKSKTDYKIKNIKSVFLPEEIQDVKERIINVKKDVRYLIRGHFLTDLVRNKMKEIAKKSNQSKMSVSNESFFSLFVDGCLNCKNKCNDKKYLKKQIDKAIKAVS